MLLEKIAGSLVDRLDPRTWLSGWHELGLNKRPEIRGDSDGKKDNYIKQAFGALIFVAIIMLFWPESIAPLTFWSPWHMKGSLWNWLVAGWPAFAWGSGFTFVMSVISRNKPEHNREAEANFASGFVVSIWAGLTEELAFRWLIFLSAVITAVIMNAVFPWFFGIVLFLVIVGIAAKVGRPGLGTVVVAAVVAFLSQYLLVKWLGANVPQAAQVHFFGPLADFFTLGYLKEWVNNPAIWHIGAGILAANAAFRDGHKYLGIVGYVNSWFLGMYFFYMTFTYGLLSAIIVHFVYDALIFFVRYLDMVYERAQGNV